MGFVSELKSLLHRVQKAEAPNASEGLNVVGHVTEEEWDALMSMQTYISAAENGPNQYANGGDGLETMNTVRELVAYRKKESNELYDSILKKHGFTRDTHRIIENRKIVLVDDYDKFAASEKFVNSRKTKIANK